MRILIIRHGDPDYENDTLTQKGWREADLLAKRLAKIGINLVRFHQLDSQWHTPNIFSYKLQPCLDFL